MNKLTATSLYTVALICFSQGTFAENNLNTISEANTNPLTSGQVTTQQSTQFDVSQSSQSKRNLTLAKPVKTNSKNSDFENENYNWVPSEWYSPY